MMDKRTTKSIHTLLISEKMVKNEIRILNVNKSCGPDEISPIILIKLVDHVAGPLAMLMKSVPGIPGEDYPIYAEAPETAFSCEGQVNGGK